MAVCTYSDVFQFVTAPTDVQANAAEQAKITALIDKVESKIEETIGRKIASTSFSNVIFQHGLNCEIYEEKLFLKGQYRDIYTISNLYENGVALTAVTAYGDNHDYYLDVSKGILIRNYNYWSMEPFAIKISGSMGLGGANPKGDIKLAIIEIVAAKTGLWKQNVQTEGGNITTIRTTPSQETMDTIKKYILREF